MIEVGAGLRTLARTALAGRGGGGWRWQAGAARRGCEEKMQWRLQTLAVNMEKREEIAAQRAKEGQQGGAAERGGEERS